MPVGVRWLLLAGAVGSAAGFVSWARHPEWLIRVVVFGLSLLALFFPAELYARRAIVIGLLIVSLTTVFYHLGAGSLYDWDEAIYAEVAKEVDLFDNWLTPTLHGAPYWHKPPFYIWLTALTYRAAGINEFSARFWSAFFGCGVLALTFFLGLRLFSWPIGAAAVLLLLGVDHSYSSHWHNFISQARVGMVETTLLFWLLLSLILAWEARARPKLILGLGVTMALAVMTKSWVGTLAWLLPFIFAVVTGRFTQQRRYWIASLLLAFGIVLPWHVWQFWFYGTAFVHGYFVVNVLGRLFGNVEGHASGDLMFYFDVIRRGLGAFGYVWPLVLIGAILSALRQKRDEVILLLIWTTIPLVLFSFAQTKLGWYIILIYPGIALLIADAAANWLSSGVALSGIGVVMALLYFRLPIPSEGAPRVKEFATAASRIVAPRAPVYIYSDADCRDMTGSMTEYGKKAVEKNVRPSYVYYMNYPGLCVPAGQFGNLPAAAQ
jgi:4-amino-4-deoxy-L-arabinose transferase-like glycosyltransferase